LHDGLATAVIDQIHEEQETIHDRDSHGTDV
jgi:hypothetical protein